MRRENSLSRQIDDDPKPIKLIGMSGTDRLGVSVITRYARTRLHNCTRLVTRVALGCYRIPANLVPHLSTFTRSRITF